MYVCVAFQANLFWVEFHNLNPFHTKSYIISLNYPSIPPNPPSI